MKLEQYQKSQKTGLWKVALIQAALLLVAVLAIKAQIWLLLGIIGVFLLFGTAASMTMDLAYRFSKPYSAIDAFCIEKYTPYSRIVASIIYLNWIYLGLVMIGAGAPPFITALGYFFMVLPIVNMITAIVGFRHHMWRVVNVFHDYKNLSQEDHDLIEAIKEEEAKNATTESDS